MEKSKHEIEQREVIITRLAQTAMGKGLDGKFEKLADAVNYIGVRVITARAAGDTVGYESSAVKSYLRELGGAALIAMGKFGCVFRTPEGEAPAARLMGANANKIVTTCINGERDYQDSKWGRDGNTLDVSEWITTLTYYHAKLVEMWVTTPGDEAALDVVRKIAAIVVCCFEQNSID